MELDSLGDLYFGAGSTDLGRMRSKETRFWVMPVWFFVFLLDHMRGVREK